MTTCSVVWIDSVVWVDSVCSVVWIDSDVWVDSVVWTFFFFLSVCVCVCVLSGFVQHPLVDPFGYDRLRLYFRVYSGWSRLLSLLGEHHQASLLLLFILTFSLL